MYLSKFTDYSFRVLMYLASQNDRLCTVGEIAEEFQLSTNHLKKIVHKLSTNHFIISVKGRSGGLKLGRLPKEINLADVLICAEENFHMAECFACENNCILNNHCKLKGIMGNGLRAFLQEFKKHTLEDLMERE
jgi:Rrf2 family transcriptional regulator, nitric oxide-sensitive transcriptional repressor